MHLINTRQTRQVGMGQKLGQKSGLPGSKIGQALPFIVGRHWSRNIIFFLQERVNIFMRLLNVGVLEKIIKTLKNISEDPATEVLKTTFILHLMDLKALMTHDQQPGESKVAMVEWH